jgi:hypothetical protein
VPRRPASPIPARRHDGTAVNGICFDCAQAAPLARFWAAALGDRIRPYTDQDLADLKASGIDDVEDDPTVAVDGPDGQATLWFGKVPEAKEHEEDRIRWTVMLDPERNGFCVQTPR